MALSSHRCAFCNEARSCVAIGVSDGKPARKTITVNAKTKERIEKWDKDCRFLCFYCIRENVANVKTRVLKVTSENFFMLRPPKEHSTLIWKGDVFYTKPTYWDQDEYAWKMTLPPGEYIALFLGGHNVRRKKKDIDKGIDMFPDLGAEQMREFIKNQGHSGK